MRVLCLGFGLLLMSRVASADLRAGVAVVDLTPPAGTPLGGYGARLGRPLQGVHDRIFAKALVLDDGAERIALVMTDLIGSDAAMQRAMAEANGLQRSQVMLCASHTHSGPGALANNVFAATAMGAFDAKFYDWMRDRLIESVKLAQAKLVPAKLAVGVTELAGRNRNRRKDATVTDPQLSVIRVDTADGKPLAALVNFSAHGTVLGADNMQVSGDWMGAMQRALEQSIGNGVVALYANGAEGDQSPVAHGADGFARCEEMGQAVAAAAKKLWDSLQPSSSVRLHALGEEMELPKTAKSLLLGKARTYLQAIALGGVVLLALPGEFIAELGLDLKARARKLGFASAIAMGLANDHLGYVLTEAEHAKGGYEVTVSFYGEKFGPLVVDTIAKLLERLR